MLALQEPHEVLQLSAEGQHLPRRQVLHRAKARG
eukprot:CAMPEP_0206405480 /NCGR_PEP_ID=MMETSP0294-20121207/29107_1 /ASSEMBLY_ACC=CAM_ASM_000327 /TAXON_ID=39354 /ORGANISM="Heterosigma akashiwo, Strain CCMP2393" /LENGTH=33 /DNA_ID= /DNA_START= /DNA_END= /DNA_ORIENTATION=